MKNKHSHRLLFSILLSCYALMASVNAQAQSSYGNYIYRKKLTLNTTNYISGSGDLSNFPVLLEITDTDLIKTGSESDKLQSFTANDLAFTDATITQSSATEYNYQIETYNPATGFLRVWVKIPTLTKSSNNTIYMYFGSNNPAPHPATKDTWGSDYAAVFHFNESSFSTDANAVKDATGTYHATISSSTNNLVSDGRIGSAYSFNGSNQKISTTNILNLTGEYTLSAWVKPSIANKNQKILSNQPDWRNGFQLGISDNAKITVDSYDQGNTGNPSIGSSQLNADNWYYIQATYQGNLIKMYVNGVLDNLNDWAKKSGGGSVLKIGTGEGDNWWFNGLIDEVRLSTIAKSEEWLGTEYNNQRYPGNMGIGLNGGLPFISDYEDLEILNTAPSIPVDNNGSANAVNENATTGTAVGITAFSTDAEGASIVYSLTDNAGGRFAIDPSTGIVTVSDGSLIDYEIKTSHQIIVSASDGGFTSSQTFTISVINVIEAVSTLRDINPASNLISENASNNTPVGITVSATHDIDATVTYSLTNNAGGRFAINSLTGVVYVADASLLNYETNNSHSITVQASDGTSSDMQSFNIFISNFYENTYGNYAFQKTITLNNNLLGINSNLSNFPILLKIQDNGLRTGSDCMGVISPGTTKPNIAFIDPNSPTTELNYEIDNYDPAAGSLLVWVKIPTLTALANNTLYMYYGASSSVVPHNDAFYKATWNNVTSSAKSYKGVWHFSEDPSNADISDASSLGNNLIKSGGVTQNTSSIVGRGATLQNGALYKAEVTGLPTNNTAQTISFWAYYTSQPSSTANMVSIQRQSEGSIQIGVRDNKVSAWGWGGNTLIAHDVIPTAGNWHHYTYSWDGTNNKLYIDGVLKNTTSATAPSDKTPTAIMFGSYYVHYLPGPEGEFFNGSIDEAQLIDAALSDDWIKASYLIQSNPEAYTSNGLTEVITENVVNTPGALTFTWTGTVSTAISHAGNWNNTTLDLPNQLPHNTGTATIIIPSGLNNYPVLSSDLSIYGLSIASGANLSLNGHSLNVKCHLLNNGQLLHNSNANSKLAFSGSLENQNYEGNSSNAQLGKLEVNNAASGTVTLSNGGIDVYDLVNVTQGTLVSNGYLTLKASANSVAGVGPLSGNQLTGNVVVESFFSGGSAAHRGTRAISSPVNESLSVVKTYEQLKSALIITGPGGTSNGFDVGGKSNPNGVSLTKYNESSTLAQSQFTSVGSITEPLPAGTGVFLFYRGNRDNYSIETASESPKVNAPYAIPENAVVKYTGPINHGDITVNLSYTNHPGEETYNGYNLVGNPYPSVINWNNVIRNNVDNEIKIIKPEGGFATYLNGDTINAGGKDLRYIQPGQAFYTRATSTGASITFTEASKVSGINNNILPRLLSAPQKPLFVNFKPEGAITASSTPLIRKRLRLSLQNEINKEEALIIFSPGNSSKARREDAGFLGGSSVSLSTLSTDKVQLGINNMPEIGQVPEISLNVNAATTGTVTLKFTDLSALEGTQALLVDNFSGKFIDVNSTPSYSFEINKNLSASYGGNRMKLLFSPITTLPVKIIGFSARKINSGSELKWTTTSELNSDKFIIERSVDGISFSSIGSMKAKGNSSSKVNYTFIDENPLNQLIYYRVKQTDTDGKFVNTAPISLDHSLKNMVELSVYPNPSSKTITLHIPNRKSALHLSFINMSGTEVKRTTIKKHENPEVSISDLASGLYLIQITENDSPLTSLKFMKQ